MKKHFMKILPYILITPAMLIIVFIVLIPIALSVVNSFTLEDGGYGIDNYLYFITDEIQRENIIYTLQVVFLTVIVCIAISYMLAVYLRFSNTRVSKIIGNLYLLPRFIPGLVAVNGMITIIRDSGLINRIGQTMGHDIELGLMYDMNGVIIMNLWFNIPFATMLMAAAMSSIPTSVIESAKDVGANKLQIFFKMIFPLTYKDVFICVAFIFMGNIGSFTTPYLMDGNHPQMLGISLFNLFGNFRYEKAAALSVIMFLLSSVTAVVYVQTNMKEKKWEKAR